jgi:hypothetical protein
MFDGLFFVGSPLFYLRSPQGNNQPTDNNESPTNQNWNAWFLAESKIIDDLRDEKKERYIDTEQSAKIP